MQNEPLILLTTINFDQPEQFHRFSAPALILFLYSVKHFSGFPAPLNTQHIKETLMTCLNYTIPSIPLISSTTELLFFLLKAYII